LLQRGDERLDAVRLRRVHEARAHAALWRHEPRRRNIREVHHHPRADAEGAGHAVRLLSDDAGDAKRRVTDVDRIPHANAQLRQQHRFDPQRAGRRHAAGALALDGEFAEQRVAAAHGLQFHQAQPFPGGRHGRQLEFDSAGLERIRQLLRQRTQVALGGNAYRAAEQRRGAGVDAGLHALREAAHAGERGDAEGHREQHGPQQWVRAAQLAAQQPARGA
jgi:hypothetical protein